MQFNSIEFLIYLPIETVVYFFIPKKLKQIWLLCARYYFYLCWKAMYALLILTSPVVTYASGLLLEKAKRPDLPDSAVRKRVKGIVGRSLLINGGVLVFFR